MLTPSEQQNIITSLQMRRNYIETGNVVMSAYSAKQQGQHQKVKALTTDQMKLIIEIDDLVNRLQSGGQL